MSPPTLSRRRASLFGAIAVALVALIGIEWARVSSAHERWSQANAKHARVLQDLQVRRDLTSKQATIADSARPTQEVLSQVRRVLTKVGIPSQQLEQIEPQADAREARGSSDSLEVRRQSFFVSLRALPPIDVGRFLQRWIQSEPLWTPTRIELVHESGQAEVGRYRVGLWLSAEYWTDGREGAAP